VATVVLEGMPALTSVNVCTTTSNREVATSPCASITLMMMAVEPLRLPAGVTVAVRLEPLPWKAMLPLGTSAVLVEMAVTSRFSAGVSSSKIVKAIGGVARPGTVI
jgi:hypothetical protein